MPFSYNKGQSRPVHTPFHAQTGEACARGWSATLDTCTSFLIALSRSCRCVDRMPPSSIIASSMCVSPTQRLPAHRLRRQRAGHARRDDAGLFCLFEVGGWRARSPFTCAMYHYGIAILGMPAATTTAQMHAQHPSGIHLATQLNQWPAMRRTACSPQYHQNLSSRAPHSPVGRLLIGGANSVVHLMWMRTAAAYHSWRG